MQISISLSPVSKLFNSETFDFASDCLDCGKRYVCLLTLVPRLETKSILNASSLESISISESDVK